VQICNGRIDKVKFNVYGIGLFTTVSAALYPISLLKTRMQVATKEHVHTTAFSLFKSIIKNDGIRGLYRGFGTTAVGSIPGRAMFLATLEISKESTNKLMSDMNIPDATKTALANAVGGLVSSLISELYYVPLDVVYTLFPATGDKNSDKTSLRGE
jgi:solute carrier family 25 protein 44